MQSDSLLPNTMPEGARNHFRGVIQKRREQELPTRRGVFRFYRGEKEENREEGNEGKKRSLREIGPFLFVGTISDVIISMIASDALKIQEYQGQIAYLQQQLAEIQAKLESCEK